MKRWASWKFRPARWPSMSQAVLRAYVVLKLPPEDLEQDLRNGPHSGIVYDLLTSTGILHPARRAPTRWPFSTSSTISGSRSRNTAQSIQKC